MLRLKQVYANTADRSSRISDDRDDRDSQFFNRQLLIDFEPRNITAAWKVDKDDWPFGFEFISRADFREINTGHSDENSPEITIAGQDAKRKGFKLCQFCGMVQTANGEGKEQDHTISCTARNKDNPTNLISGLFLYREFHSEAIRILLPITSGTEAEIIENSFVAALHLGLKKKFGGSIEHLRVAQNIEPDTETGVSKQYLVIYDAIPGGTGYLKQLMTNQHALMEVLTDFAMPVLEQCSCVQKESADGCYRCLYVYRNSRDMNTISRRKARDFIQTLKQHSSKVIPVAGLREIKISPLLESELEARFIEALRRAGKDFDQFELRPEFHRSAAGWYLRFNEQRYFLEPQVLMDAGSKIAVQSRADFVLWPLGASGLKPIVIFTDGYQYHKNRLALDTAQRLAILASNDFWVWSLSYNDVQTILDGKVSAHLNLFLDMPNDNVKKLSGQFMCEELLALRDRSSFAWLIHFINTADQSVWERYAAMTCFIWFSKVERQLKSDNALAELSLPEYAQRKLDYLGDTTVTSVDSTGQLFGNAYQRFYLSLCLDKSALQQGNLNQLSAIIVFNDQTALDESELDLNQWQAFLRVINLIQFQYSSSFFTVLGIAKQDYADLTVSPLSDKSPSSEWDLLLADAIGDECAIINKLSVLGLPIPQCGFELNNELGEIVAEGFLAWPDLNVVIIFDEFESDIETFIKAGWKVFSSSELDKDFQSLLSVFA